METDDTSSNPYSPPALTTQQTVEIEPNSPSKFTVRKRRKLRLILRTVAILGFGTGLLPEGSSPERILTFATGLYITILVLGWCEIDGEERSLTRWRFFVPMMVFIPGPVIMVPIYLFVTRGIEGFIATAKAFGFFVLLMIVFVATYIIGSGMSGKIEWIT